MGEYRLVIPTLLQDKLLKDFYDAQIQGDRKM